jgi:hypothetical protein
MMCRGFATPPGPDATCLASGSALPWTTRLPQTVATTDWRPGRLILERFPEAGPARPDVADDATVLVEPLYLIVYRIVPAGPQIVRVLRGARHIDAALFGEGME